MAHVHGRPDNEAEWFDDLLGRGPGDPDVHGYPSEPKEEGVEPDDRPNTTSPDLETIPF